MLRTSTSLALSIALLLGASSTFAASGDGIIDAANPPPQYTSATGPDWELDSLLAPEATNHYLFIAGSALTPRDSAATVTYPGAGCTTVSSALTTDLQLPHGSTLLGVRTFYYDNAATGSVHSWVTRYDGLGNISDLLSASMPHATGYAENYNALGTTEVIDNLNYSYVLIANTGTGTRICGFRVFYSTP